MRKIESYVLRENIPALAREKSGALYGVVYTPFGLVLVDAFAPGGGKGHAVLVTVQRGREYRTKAHRAKPFTARGLAIIAGRFAAEVAAQATNRGRHG